MPDIQNKTATKKDPVEISCTQCDTRFRVWIPTEMSPELDKGVRIRCIRCGAQFFVKKKGTDFDISLVAEVKKQEPPLPQAPAPTIAKAPVIAPSVTFEAKPAAAPKASVEPSQTHDPGLDVREIILVVEDDRLSRDMVENSLEEIGFRIIPVKNAEEALRAVNKEQVHLIVTDLYLKNPSDPDSQLDGEDLLKKLRDSGIIAPAIITTGKDIIDDLVLDPKWFDLMVKGFIQKGNPFWVEELKLKVKEVLYKG